MIYDYTLQFGPLYQPALDLRHINTIYLWISLLNFKLVTDFLLPLSLKEEVTFYGEMDLSSPSLKIFCGLLISMV